MLRDEDLHSWFLDPDIDNDPARPGCLRNTEPLLVNLVDTWALRPEATTAIPNLFLASDYVRTTPTSRRWRAPMRRRGAR